MLVQIEYDDQNAAPQLVHGSVNDHYCNCEYICLPKDRVLDRHCLCLFVSLFARLLIHVFPANAVAYTSKFITQRTPTSNISADINKTVIARERGINTNISVRLSC